MKKTILKSVLTIMLFLAGNLGIAQNLVQRDYQFTQSISTYTPLTGGTQLNAANDDDQYYSNVLIGFPFRYNGRDYDTVGVGNNGFIAFLSGNSITFSAGGSSIGGFGTSGGSALYNFESPIRGYNFGPMIAAFNMDLHSRTNGRLTAHRTGSAPNRTFTLQWAQYERYSGSSATDNLNFQLVLTESNNGITVNYGNMSLPTANDGGAQVGLRGSDTTDINARTGLSFTNTNASTYATEDIRINSGTIIPSGLSFSWLTGPPAAIDVAVTNILKPANVPGSLCIASVTDSVKFSIRNFGSDPVTSLPVTYRLNGGAPVQQTFTFSPALQARENATLTFPTPITLSSGSVFSIQVFAQLAGEAPANRRNDTLTKNIIFSSITGNSSIYPSWTTDFGGRTSQNIPVGWFGELLAGTNQWTVDSLFFDPGNSLSTPFRTQQGPGFLFFPSFQTSTRGSIARASTPCLNLNNWPTNEPAWLTFSMNQDSDWPTFQDSVLIQVALDGQNYATVGRFSRYNPDVTPYTWKTFGVDLSAYRNQIIRIGFVAKSRGGNNLAIDFASVQNTVPVSTPIRLVNQQVFVYPNPTTGTLNIKLPNNQTYTAVEILNTVGQVVLSQSVGGIQEGELQLNLSGLTAGTYQVRVIGQNKQFLQRITKQ